MTRAFKFNRRRGSILLIAMFFVAILAIVMIPVAQFSGSTARMAYGTRSSDKAFYAAEAGIAKALSYVYAQGNGAVTGIYNPKFSVTESNAFYPFGNSWLTLDEGVSTSSNPQVGYKVRVWQDASVGEWYVEATGRADRPREMFRTVTATIGAGSFARYAFFNTDSLSSIDGKARWLADGETFNGPVHTNRHLFVRGAAGDPLVFNSDVTIVGDEVLGSSSSYVKYNGLKDTNAQYVELPSNLSSLINAADNGGLDLPGDDTFLQSPPAGYVDPVANINNYRFVFNSNGTVTVTNVDAKTWATANGKPYTPMTVTLSNTNGAVIVRNGNAFVSGTLKGKVTIGALANDSNTSLVAYNSSTKTDGNVIVEGNMVYSTHPTTSGGALNLSDDREFDIATTTDVMGLIAERNFLIDGSMPSTGVIDAHLMVTGQASPNPDVRTWPTTTNPDTVIAGAVNQDGAFFIEDGVQRDLSELWTGVVDGEPGNGNNTGTWKTGNLYLTGGIVHFLRGQTKNGSGGYDRRYAFDGRLMITPPPYYPLTPDLEIVGWSDIASVNEP